MSILLDNGVDLQFVDDSELPASHIAAFTGHIPMLSLLIERRTDLHYKSAGEDGQSALHSAVHGGHIPMLKYLFKEVGIKKDERTQELIESREIEWMEELESKLVHDDEDAARRSMVAETAKDPQLQKRYDYIKNQYQRLSP